MAKPETQSSADAPRNAFTGVSSQAPPKFVEFAGVRGYSYAAQALLKLAEGCPDNTTAAIFIVGAALCDTVRYSGMPRRKPQATQSE